MDFSINQTLHANTDISKYPKDKVKVAQDFEAIFLRQMINDIYKSDSQDLKGVRSMQSANIADVMSKSGGIGLSRFLLENWNE